MGVQPIDPNQYYCTTHLYYDTDGCLTPPTYSYNNHCILGAYIHECQQSGETEWTKDVFFSGPYGEDDTCGGNC